MEQLLELFRSEGERYVNSTNSTLLNAVGTGSLDPECGIGLCF